MMILVLAATMDRSSEHFIEASSRACMSQTLQAVGLDRSSLVAPSAGLCQSHTRKQEPLRHVFNATGKITASDAHATSKHINLFPSESTSEQVMHNSQME